MFVVKFQELRVTVNSLENVVNLLAIEFLRAPLEMTLLASRNRVRDFDRSRIFRATLRSILDAPRLYLELLWEPGRGDSYTTV